MGSIALAFFTVYFAEYFETTNAEYDKYSENIIVFADKHSSDEYVESGIQFNIPEDVTIDKFGNIFVIDAYNQRVILLDSNGYFKHVIGEFGNGNGEIQLSPDLYVDNSGKINVDNDVAYNRISVFDSDGNLYMNDAKSQLVQIDPEWTDYWRYDVSEDIYVQITAILVPMVIALMLLPILESKKIRFHKKNNQM